MNATLPTYTSKPTNYTTGSSPPQGTSSNNGIEERKTNNEKPLENIAGQLPLSVGTGTNNLMVHYPAAVIKRNIFMNKDVTTHVLKYCPIKNNLSLVNRSLNQLNREFFFLPLLRKIPEINQQIDNGNVLIEVAEEMGLRNESEFAKYLGRNLSSENKEEVIPDALSMLTYLADQGCPTAQYELGLFYYRGGQGIEIDYKKAYGWFVKAQEKSSNARRVIGAMFYLGHGVQKDLFLAEEWLHKAIVIDPLDHKAYHTMGAVLQHSPKRRDQAFSCFQKSADLGSVSGISAMMIFAVQWNWTIGSQLELAMEYLDKAIRSGQSIPDQTFTQFVSAVWRDHEFTGGIKGFLLGHLYVHGWDTPKDVVKGTNHWMDAVKEGNEKALLTLSEWYIQTKMSKSDYVVGVDLHTIKQFVIKHLEKAVKDGRPEARYTLGAVYEADPSEESQQKARSYFELAVVRDKHKKALEKIGPIMLARAAEHLENGEYGKAVAIYIPMAEAGDDDAKQKIAFMFIGKMVSKIDQKLLANCLEHLANQGSADAAFELANWHMSVPFIKNSEQAIKWYVNAYYRGRTDASYKLGLLFSNKSIFSSSAELLEAKKWFELAVKANITDAKKKLAEVEKKLNRM